MAKTPIYWIENVGSEDETYLYDSLELYVSATTTFDGVVPDDMSESIPTGWIPA